MTVNRLRPAVLLALLVASVAVAAPITSAEITFPTDSGIFLTDAVGVLNESEKSEAISYRSCKRRKYNSGRSHSLPFRIT